MPEFLLSSTFLFSAAVVFIVLLLLILGYLKAPPDTAYAVSYTHLPFADPVHGNLSPVALVGIPQPSDQGKQGHRCSHAEIGYHLSKVGKCIRDGTVKQAEHDHQCLPDGIALGIEDKRSGADEGCSQGHKIHTVEEEKGCKNQSGGAAPQGQLTL